MGIFFDITVIICIAAFLSIVFRIFKQPEILAYILTGIIIGPLGLFHISDHSILQTMSQFGITLLLFMVGLEINFKDLLSQGRKLFLIALSQILLTILVSFGIGLALGFSTLNSIYLALALTFSSTIIIVKLLSDQRDLHSLYARISIGVLLAQDLLAIIALIFLSSFQSGGTIGIGEISVVLLKALLLFGGIAYLSTNIFPKIVELLAKSSETLFLVSLAWVFGLAALVSSPLIGFSIEIGGFLAGLALANSIANFQIIAKAKILRDFFIVIFFVLLGLEMSFNNFTDVLIPGIIISLFVIIGKPLIVMLILSLLGYKNRTSFLTSISLSQISEFSLIILFLGLKIGHVSEDLVSSVTIAAIISFMVSTYLISNDNDIYLKVKHLLKIFDFKTKNSESNNAVDEFENLKDHVVVVGGDQMGQSIIETLNEKEIDVVVIDFDPLIINKLKDKKAHQLFGDIADLDIQERSKIDSAKLVISTIPDLGDNLSLLRELRTDNRKAKIVVMALDNHDANVLYNAGADYVILPHLAGGRQIAKLLHEDKLGDLEKLKQSDKSYIT